MAYASQNGLQNIEINLTREHSALTSFSADRIANLNQLSEKHDVKLSIHLPHSVNIADILPPIRQRYVNYLNKTIELAHQLKTTHITVHMGNFFWFPVSHWNRRRALDRFIKNIRPLIPLCEEKKVVIAIENVVPIPHGTDFYLLGDNINDFKYIFTQINSPMLRFCLDTGHANIAEGVLEYLQEFDNRLVCVHYHDNYGDNDAHLPPGEGTVPWRRFIATLNQLDFTGPFISECRDIRPHEAAALLEGYF